MRQYCAVGGCRRCFLLKFFGERLLETCSNCDNCLGAHEQSVNIQ